MRSYKTPGVYVQEVSKIPPSISSVETNIPVFIGYTDTHTDLRGEDLKQVAHKISSITDFEDCYGKGIPESLEVTLSQVISAISGHLTTNSISIGGNMTGIPTAFLYYSMQMYFHNGGGPCIVISIGQKPDVLDRDSFLQAINLLNSLKEPTLVLFPDACLFSPEKYSDIVDTALFQCAANGNRMLILDVLDAYKGKNETNSTINTNFRSRIVSEVKYLKHCAAYFPYLESTYPFSVKDQSVKIVSHIVKSKNSQGITQSSVGAFEGLTLAEANLKEHDVDAYNAIISQIIQTAVIIPPSGAIAGAIVKTDEDRGVWKAPANISLSFVKKPALSLSNNFQNQLSVDSTGKSINAIREFPGKGTLIWGARTLAGNDNEWRYISVVRFFMCAQESIRKGTERFVFEPNDANTWTAVKNTIESYLATQWREGALAGSKADEAFYVRVGLGETMTRRDLVNKKLIIEIGMAIMRPAEFIIMRIDQKMNSN